MRLFCICLGAEVDNYKHKILDTITEIDILLIVPPYRLVAPYDNYKLIDPPRSLTILGTILDSLGYSVRIIDMPINGMGYDDITIEIDKFNPKIIGLQNRSTYSFPIVKKLAETIKRKYDATPILVGGTHVTYNPIESLSDCEYFDYVLAGEAEDSLPAMLNFLLNKFGNINDINGLVYRNEKGEIIQSNKKNSPAINLDNVPIPDYSLIPIEKYVSRKERYILDLGRGCLYNCPYCTSRLGVPGIRFRKADMVVKEIKYAYNLGFRNFYFFDNIFTANRELVIEVCRKIIKEKIQISWPCMTVLEMVDRELLGWMKRAGCDLIAYGVETITQKALENIVKHKGNQENIKNVFMLTRENGIRPLAFVIHGLPGTTFIDELKTIKFITQIQPDAVRAFCFKPFPGSTYYKNLEKYGINIVNDDFNRWSILDEPTHETTDLTKDEIIEARLLSEYLFRSGGVISAGDKYRRRKNVILFKTNTGGVLYNPFVPESIRKTDMYLNGLKLDPMYFEVLYRCDGYHNESDLVFIMEKIFDLDTYTATKKVVEIINMAREKELLVLIPDVMDGNTLAVTSEDAGRLVSSYCT